MLLSRSAPAALLLAVFTAGCATAPGTPSAVPSGASGTSSTAGSAASVLPPRPREIQLDGLDPCQLWTPEQLRLLAVQVDPVAGGQQENAAGYPVCTYRTARQDNADLGYSATAVLDLDASIYLGKSGPNETTVLEVGGFPAVQESSDSAIASPCRLAISTSTGQHLQVRAETRPGAYSIEQACEMTLRAATLAVQTLQTLR